MARQGAYTKGIVKREEILEAALAVVAAQGYRGASVREIADASGLSPAGLLHYFGTKEELFIAILQARDARDIHGFTSKNFIENFLAVLRHNSAVPGLVNLYARLAADAGDPSHPATAFFRNRNALFEHEALEAIATAQACGEIRKDVNPAWVIRAARALADGLQTAWMIDSSIDMAADVEEFLRLLRPAEPQN